VLNLMGWPERLLAKKMTAMRADWVATGRAFKVNKLGQLPMNVMPFLGPELARQVPRGGFFFCLVDPLLDILLDIMWSHISIKRNKGPPTAHTPHTSPHTPIAVMNPESPRVPDLPSALPPGDRPAVGDRCAARVDTTGLPEKPVFRQYVHFNGHSAAGVERQERSPSPREDKTS
jgi:hypothetical protein